ncbi:hypothetical protein NMY22_g14990 [Coprinellus aureogranulatus]|nr:hypothetical protein NMY22_g14990 [Coprinellus aureogranulatus]
MPLQRKSSPKEAELEQRIASIQESLDNQEAIYSGKVQAVKDEHNALLNEAYERAKKEAGVAHAQELQNLRAESNATIGQIQSQNKSNLESLQSDHAAELDAVTKDYKKQIGNLNLELKATKDDLAKSKAALEEARKELQLAREQLEAAKASADAVPTISSDQTAEVARLAQELSVTKDDLAAVTDMLNLTKSSLTEMSEKHQKDLEESGKLRAEEFMKVAAAHDEEIKALASQKHDLLIRLSDLEGELSTAKAALSAAQTASPKANEELAKLHEAHTHKIYDLQAEHEQLLKALREELQKAQENNTQLKEEVERKNMEMRYLESDLEELQSEVIDLKERLGESDNKMDTA